MSDSCIVCGKAGPFGPVSPNLRDSDRHAVVECLSCSHFQIFPLPNPTEDQDFYDTDRQTKNLDESIDLETLSRKKAHDTRRRIGFLQEHGFLPGSSLIDVGSGYGMFLAEAFRQGYQAVGIEISEERRRKAATLTEAQILNVNLMEDSHQLGSYDVVTLFQVVEHLTEPQILLRRLAGLLRPNGALVVEVPNLDDIALTFSSAYKRFFWQRAHVSYFNPSGLRTILKQAGYGNVEIYGLQRYGLGNLLHWTIRSRPQVKDPSFEAGGVAGSIERVYKRWLEQRLSSDSIIAIARP